MTEKIIELCKPVEDYLRKNYDPYVEVVITDEGIHIKQTVAYSPQEEQR